jgi:hypothetical protein
MGRINQLLDTAMKCLLRKAAKVIESGAPHADATTVCTLSRLRTASATASFPVDWPSLLRALQRSLYDTAFHVITLGDILTLNVSLTPPLQQMIHRENVFALPPFHPPPCSPHPVNLQKEKCLGRKHRKGSKQGSV